MSPIVLISQCAKESTTTGLEVLGFMVALAAFFILLLACLMISMPFEEQHPRTGKFFLGGGQNP